MATENNSNAEDNFNEDKRRQKRRVRRRKSQLTAYFIVTAFIIIISGAAFVSVCKVSSVITKIRADSITKEKEKHKKDNNLAILSPDSSSIDDKVSEENDLESRINDTISSMTIEQKAASLFIVTPEQLTGVDGVVKAGSSTQTALSKYTVGGIVYLANNLKDANQINEMLSDTMKMSSFPLFLAISETGGDKSLVANATGAEVMPNPQDLSGSKAKEAGETIGSYLVNAGFNLDMSLSANLSDKPECFGTDEGNVASKLYDFSSSIEEKGVCTCIGDFPVQMTGNGDTESNDSSKEELSKSSLKAFEEMINSGTAIIQMSNINMPNLTGDDNPCSMSAVAISNMLRSDMGFTGIVMTGPMNQKAVTDKYSADVAAVNAIAAGADMIYLPADFQTAYNGILTAVQNGTLTEDRINESLQRIFKVKFSTFVNLS